MMNPPESENDAAVALYNIAWVSAFFLSLVATILSVILLLIINESGNRAEAAHYLQVLDESTRGIGSHSPVIFLYLSLVGAIAGLIIWLYMSYDAHSASFIVCFIFICGIGILFLIFLLHSVSALYFARHTQAKIQIINHHTITLSEIRKHLFDLIDDKKGFENIKSEKEFIDYISYRKHDGTKSNSKRNLTETSIALSREMFKQELTRRVKAIL